MEHSKFQLQDQRLIKSVYEINREYDSENDIDIEMSTEISIAKNDELRKALVQLFVKIFDGEKKESYPFFMELGIEGVFYWDGDLENVERYLEINAPAILMSYIRSVASQLTVFSGQSPLILPLINFKK